MSRKFVAERKGTQMKNSQIILTLTLIVCAASVAWAQDDENQPPATTPAPAFGQDNPAPTVTENPPISAIDQPGLEPHAAPESFLLPGLHFSESVDSNEQDSLGGSSVGTVTRGLGSLTLQKLWKNYDVAVDYIGGAAYYSRTGVGLEQLQQFDMDNRINWKRGQLAIRDSFSYLPEGTFGFGAYGGSGAYNSGLGSLGQGMLGGMAFGGQTNNFQGGGGDLTIGQVPRLTNLGIMDVVENLTPKSAITFAVGYGIVHFYGSILSLNSVNQNLTFIGSTEYTGQVAYDRVLTPKDQVAVSYGYQGFNFSTANSAFHTNVVQAMYGHRISGRLDFLIAAGPQFTHVDQNPFACDNPFIINPNQCTFPFMFLPLPPQTANTTNVAGRLSIRYRFPKTSVALTYSRFNTSGGGVFAGALSNIAHLDIRRPLSRVWDLFSDFGYSKNQRLQEGGSTVNASSFTSGFAGIGLHRQFGRDFRGFVSYQFNESGFDTACPLLPNGSTSNVLCSHISQRHVGTIGVDWTPRPIRLD